MAFTLIGFWLASGAFAFFLQSKQPRYSGYLVLPGLARGGEAKFDSFGIPHIQAETEEDAYRMLGYLHAQDRLFQMEMSRRVARGELAEILGPDLLPVDRLFRTLRLRQHAEEWVRGFDTGSDVGRAASAYVAGINHYLEVGATPIEFQLLGIPMRPFTLVDTVAIAGYMAYGFATGWYTDPLLTHVRERHGDAYLADLGFDRGDGPWVAEPRAEPDQDDAFIEEDFLDEELLDEDLLEEFWLDDELPDGNGARQNGARQNGAGAADTALRGLEPVVALMHGLQDELAWTGGLAGSNAWALSGALTHSGRPILASDPHVAFSQPSVWYEAQLTVQPGDDAESGTEGGSGEARAAGEPTASIATAPVFDLYGHHLAGVPFAMLGHNFSMAWGVTMFKNDDIDLYIEELNPANPNEVKYRGAWEPLRVETEIIRVKGGPDVQHVVRITPHGPILNDVFPALAADTRPVALKWGWHSLENDLLGAAYRLAHSDGLASAREAVRDIHAPGLNIVYANADGDIAWWAAARIPARPPHVHPSFLLDGASGRDEYDGYWPFADNPQIENPPSGMIISANHEPRPTGGGVVWGYYNDISRAQRIRALLEAKDGGWTVADMQQIQLDTGTDYYARMGRLIPPIVERSLATVPDPLAAEALAYFWDWDGSHGLDAVAPTLFQQFRADLLELACRDELGPVHFESFLKTKMVDRTLPRLLENRDSPWWDNLETTDRVETRNDIVAQAWSRTVRKLADRFGGRPSKWTWNRAHQLTHVHPVGRKAPFGRFFNVGPYPVPGGRETINNMSFALDGAGAPVAHGPSTRRLFDLGDIEHSLGINPTGQSGYFLNRHYDNQAWLFAQGQYRPQIINQLTLHASHKSKIVFAPR